MADRVEVSTIETTDGTIGIIRDNAARQSIANLREGKETVGSVAWENVKGRPTKVSELENDKNYQTDENVSNTLNSTLYAGSSTHGGPATSAEKLTTARTISLTGAASGSGSFDGSANSSINVQSLDATKLTGTVPITNLPPSVIERMSIVKDETERLALTKDKVQDGDVVKVQSSGLIYYVVDDDKLNEEAGYEVFKAGTAASVPWGGVTGKPSSYPPSSHTHTKSQITDFPSSMPNPNNLTMQIEGNNAAVYNGGTAQTFNVTKSALGLDKVNNTADADKSVKYASSAPWTGVTGKPSSYPPSSHTHTKSQITDLGVFGGASATAAGSAGLVPQPAAGDQDKYLSAKGTWESITGKISGTKVTSANSADKLTTAHTLTIGNTSKSFDGSANVSWSLSEIGALPVNGKAVDSDNLDGFNENAFLRYRGKTSTEGTDTLWSQIGIREYHNAHPEGITDGYDWGSVVSLPGIGSRFDLWYNHHTSSNGDGLRYRTGWENDKKAWATILDSVNYNKFATDTISKLNSPENPALLGSEDDLNNVLTGGFYHINNGYNPANMPSGNDNAVLLVMQGRSHADIVQILISGNSNNILYRTGNTIIKFWEDWRKIADNSVATESTDGLMSAADKKAVDREFFRLVPKGGTRIPANADLNSIEYIKVGSYYNPAISELTPVKNIPVGNAFIMYVLAPISEVYDNEETYEWVYRLRIFIDYSGQIFTQLVHSDTTPGNFTYGPWVKMTNSNDLGAVSNKSAKYTLAASNWSGSSAPYTYDLGPTYGSNAIIGFDSETGTEEQLEAASAANIQGSSSTKIYAFGDKPTVDIPIIIQYS